VSGLAGEQSAEDKEQVARGTFGALITNTAGRQRLALPSAPHGGKTEDQQLANLGHTLQTPICMYSDPGAHHAQSWSSILFIYFGSAIAQAFRGGDLGSIPVNVLSNSWWAK
jgi:hypothetical protein